MPADTLILLDLTRRYLEPHRRYHSLPHIAEMLERGRDLRLTDEQVMAVWFHDAIYDTHSQTNEEDSAALARSLLVAAGWPEPRVATVERIVLDTKRHEPSVPESALVIDLDLASLAAPKERFAANTVAIRQEYSWVPDAEFVAGRKAFFAALLRRPRIYTSEWGRSLETAARANLAAAIA
jgi:predicted metal-dependent HD superfamily phosphohydrolase